MVAFLHRLEGNSIAQSLNHEQFVAAVDTERIVWKRHASNRLEQRGIRHATALDVVRIGERIEDYPDDHPFPSALCFGWDGDRPMNVVAAYDSVENRAIL